MHDKHADEVPDTEGKTPAVANNEEDDGKSSSSARPEVIRSIQQFVGMAQIGPRPDPLLEKMTSEQVSHVLTNHEEESKRRHDRELARENSHRTYFIAGLVLIVVICWLFLGYDKTEHLDAVIAAVVGLIGGYGFGRAKATSE